jgi:hypothetical protein
MGILVALEAIKRLKARCVSLWTLSKEVGVYIGTIGNSGRRNVTSLSPSRMDWWIIGVNRSLDFSCLPTTSAAIRWRDPHFVGWLQGPHHCRPDPARMERPHFVGWLQNRSFVDQTRPEDGKTPFRGGRHYKARSTDGETPFRGVVTRSKPR